ncbi:2-isopropylmalate synthase [Nannochloropsis oceanica]
MMATTVSKTSSSSTASNPQDDDIVRPIPTRHDIETGRDPMRVKIFDTTLRDGEQSPGCTMTAEEKVQVARQLSRLGVDIIEAGFPIASPGDFDAVKRIAQTVGNTVNPPIICGLARALHKDIETCWEAVKHAAFPRIHTFIATSDIHMQHKLKKSRAQVLEITREMVTYARSLCEDVEFSAEDALRSDPAFLYEVYSVAVEAGATTLNVPDTVGYTTPSEFKSLIRGLRANVKGIQGVTISVHGFGRTPESELALTNICTTEIYKTSRLVSTLTGMVIQPNKAIVGANAFAHESGIHQDGMLKNKSTYEIMDAESIGLAKNGLVLGKHSGRAAFRSRLTELGYESLTDAELNKAFVRFKEVADKKKEITNLDLESIVNDEMRLEFDAGNFELVRCQVICGDSQVPTATIGLLNKETNEEIIMAATGTGPVDAAYVAVTKALGIDKIKLLEFAVSSVTAGIDALGEVTVRLEDLSTGMIYYGRSANTDVVVAATQAYLSALNRVAVSRGSLPLHPQFGKI